MNQTQFMQQHLEELQQRLQELPPLPADQEMEALVWTYLTARERIEAFIEQQAQAKRRVRQIIEETGISEWNTLSGSVIVPADGIVVTYDAAALDAVRQASKTVNRFILPHRRETLRSGGIRITPYER